MGKGKGIWDTGSLKSSWLGFEAQAHWVGMSVRFYALSHTVLIAHAHLPRALIVSMDTVPSTSFYPGEILAPRRSVLSNSAPRVCLPSVPFPRNPCT